ncbi:unnamed protein product, partial [Soboliphyme baturini]|uniref:pantothenate kinase n=1 Tax=Soboliphyme baturini TaxID=241478 RepID=A0A183J6W2_9BILA
SRYAYEEVFNEVTEHAGRQVGNYVSKFDREDEVLCLIKGCNFLLRNIPDESFSFHYHEKNEYQFQTVDPCNVFPYLLVNIGSGVSIVKVDSDVKFERIGGTSLGGGTFWGLGSLLTEAKGFDALLALAEQGDHRNIDMLVGDIYGGSYETLGMSHDLIASKNSFDQKDIVRSLLLTISNVIGQLAYLYATVNSISRIYFAGYFIRGHPVTMRTISFAINYWSKGTMSALFLRHEGYPGVIGAFLKGAEEDSK